MRTGRWLAIGGTLLTLATGAFLYGAYRIATSYWDFGAAAAELPEAVAAYRAEGLPFVAAEIAPPHPKASEDATPALRAALKLLPKSPAERVLIQEARDPSPAADPILAAYAPALARIETVRDHPRVDFDRDWDLGPDLTFPELPGLKVLGRAAAARAVRRAQKGDDDAALKSLDLARRIAVWIGEEPTLIAMLVRIAVEAMAIDAVERCLAASAGDRKRIARYAAWIQKSPPLPIFGDALRGEAWMAVSTVRNLDVFGAKDANGESIPVDPRRLRRGGVPDGTMQPATMARLLQVWTEASRETDRFRLAPQETGRIMNAVGVRWEAKRGLSRTLVMILFPIVGQAGKAIVNVQAQRAVALGLAEALDAKARTGRWPAAVSGKDPFTGGPLKVKVGKDFRVYSVGRNGVDDGGRLRREMPKLQKGWGDEVAAYPPVPR